MRPLAGGAWSPLDVGRSLPIAPLLRRWRWGLWAVLTLLTLAMVWRLWRLQNPRVIPLDATATASLVNERSSRVVVEPWRPEGVPDLRADLPPFPEPRAARIWQGVPEWDALSPAARDALATADTDRNAGETVAAIAGFRDAAELAPAAWLPKYQAGVLLLGQRDHGLAEEALIAARDRLGVLAAAGAAGAEPIAADIATLYALARARVDSDCIGAVGDLKTAVAALSGYIDAAPKVRVYDRSLPFEVAGTGLSNHDLWLTLVDGYRRCGERYPREYVTTHTDSTFLGEYTDPGIDEVRSGPFPDELAGCIGTAKKTPPHQESARCWMISNLNRLHYANRAFYPDPDAGPQAAAPPRPSRARDDRARLGRLAFAVAWVLSQPPADSRESEGAEDRAPAMSAQNHLQQARWLLTSDPRPTGAQKAESAELLERIDALGRYLASRTQDYSLLAKRYAGAEAEGLALDEDTPPEKVLGIAWVLSQRWGDMIRRGAVKEAFAEIDAQRRRSGPYGDSLVGWRDRLRAALRAELVAAMKQARGNEDLPTALAIRDLEAPYLGAEWEGEAARGWRPVWSWIRWSLLWAVLAAALWTAHRLVVYPYLLLTGDFYRLEFQRRHARAKAMKVPFTRNEIEAHEGLEAERRAL